jgi:hypothetical protein
MYAACRHKKSISPFFQAGSGVGELAGGRLGVCVGSTVVVVMGAAVKETGVTVGWTAALQEFCTSRSVVIVNTGKSLLIFFIPCSL